MDIMENRKKELKNAYKNRPRAVGVFQIRNLVNGKIFVAGSISLDVVFNRHRSQLKFGGHPNQELQKDWNELGPDNFAFEILDQLKPNEDPQYDYKEDLAVLEELWLDKLQPFGAKGYNKQKQKR